MASEMIASYREFLQTGCKYMGKHTWLAKRFLRSARCFPLKLHKSTPIVAFYVYYNYYIRQVGG